MEHERFQDLQEKYKGMQEDYETQLKVAKEGRIRALEELTQLYEAKLQEKTQLLAEVSQEEHMVKPVRFFSLLCFPYFDFFIYLFLQCQEDSQQQIQEYKEIIKQVEEDEERKIHDIQIKYEKTLHTEKESNVNLKGEADVMTQKVSKKIQIYLLLYVPNVINPVHVLFLWA